MFASAQELVSADSLRTVIDAVLAQGQYQVAAPRDPWAPVRRLWSLTLDALDRLRTDNPLVYRGLVWFLVAVLLAIVAHAMWVAARTIQVGSAAETKERLQPLSAPRDASWYAQEAARLAAAGRFADAMQADFLRLMLELDARNVTRFHPSRTPGEYTRDPRLSAASLDELRALVRSLYAHAFARVPADASAWEVWRARATADRYAPAH
jgi:hypothetical protein